MHESLAVFNKGIGEHVKSLVPITKKIIGTSVSQITDNYFKLRIQFVRWSSFIRKANNSYNRLN